MRNTDDKKKTFRGTADELARHMAPYVARAKVSDTVPYKAGESYLYEITAGWESDLLRRDTDTLTVRNGFELEQAFFAPRIKTIYVPQDASITRNIIRRVCSRHGQGKTVFYEVNKDE